MLKFMSLSSTIAVVLVLIMHRCVQGAPHSMTIRLCSKSLSDALYLVCKDRGFNEPFSYTDGMDSKEPRGVGTGLVEECCHQPCSLQQLELYCKPLAPGDNSNGKIEESLRIVNLPFSLSQTVSKEGVANGRIKSKKRHQNHRISQRGKVHKNDFPKVFQKQTESLGNSRNRQDQGKSMKKSEKNDNGRSFLNDCQRRRKKSHRCTQAELKASLKRVPNFVIGTILPEPNGSLVLFPSKSHEDYCRIAHNFPSNVSNLEVAMMRPVTNRQTHKSPVEAREK